MGFDTPPVEPDPDEPLGFGVGLLVTLVGAPVGTVMMAGALGEASMYVAFGFAVVAAAVARKANWTAFSNGIIGGLAMAAIVVGGCSMYLDSVL